MESAAASAPALVLTAASLYLHRITGEREVSLALPVTARRGKLATSTPSMLSNIVPIRTGIAPGASVGETITAMGAKLRGALIHQRLQLRGPRRANRIPGPVRADLPAPDSIFFGTARGKMNILSTGPIDDLAIIVHGLGQGGGAKGGDATLQDATLQDVTVQFEANAGLYTAGQLEDHLDRFVRVLGAVAAQPHATMASMAVTTAEEERFLLAAGDAGDALLPGHTIVEEFQLSARQSGDRTAVVAPDGELTFAELERRSNQLARFLKGHGAGPGATVAVRLDRSVLLPGGDPRGAQVRRGLPSAGPRLSRRPRRRACLRTPPPVRLLTSAAFTGNAASHDEAGGPPRSRHGPRLGPGGVLPRWQGPFRPGALGRAA